MTSTKTTVSGALEQLRSKLGPYSGIPANAFTNEREDLIVRYTLGSGEFVILNNQPKIKVKGKMYKFNGEEDGEWLGIDQPIVPIEETFVAPPTPKLPFDKPEPPVDPVKILSFAKGIWKFGDGSSITAIGPAQIRVIYYVDGSAQLWVSGNQIITNGTGKYAGAQGLKTVGGSTFVPAAKAANLALAGTFVANTIEVFRLVKSQYIGQFSGS
jgi:hypothetical protein